MVRFSIAFIAALCIASSGVSQVNDLETYFSTKNKPKGTLPPIVLDTKNLPLEAYRIVGNDSTSSVKILDTNALNNRMGGIPNRYQGDNCVPIPNAYKGDNCIPIPNAYRMDAIILPNSETKNEREGLLKQLTPKKGKEKAPTDPD